MRHHSVRNEYAVSTLNVPDEGGYCFYGRTVMTPIKYHDYLCLSISRVVVRVADHGDSHGQAILGHGNVGLNAELDVIVFSTQEIYDSKFNIHLVLGITSYHVSQYKIVGPNVVVKIEDCDMYQQDGHALLVIGYGYKDGRLYCVCKNPNSVEWGSNGYLKLDFSLLRNFYASREVYFKSLKQVRCAYVDQ
ncbi:hypothetical protein T459_02791 [Capsicum annuum]|uniref:Peptidase C1A papain C-terminal domain-containing protein n=1 Tax=Capsicum annuum TaxID=4072 RepID=A0A2G3AL00_CAPAN|nr:hypothetical protein T459_02791 [Capsicum annuum]